MKLVHRLLIYSLGLVTFFMIIVATIVEYRLNRRVIAENGDDLIRTARIVARQWERGADPEELAASASWVLNGRVSLIDNTGIIVADAAAGGLTAARVGTRAQRPEVRQALGGRLGISVQQSTRVDGQELHVAVPTNEGIVRLGVHTAPLQAIFEAARLDLVTAGVVAFALAGILALLFGRYVSRPIIQLRDIAQGMAAGEFGRHAPVHAPGEVGDLADALQHLSLRLQNLEKLRREFISNVSHELCSPLAIASGFAATLVRQDPTPEQQREFARAILSNTDRMQRVIDDMLDLSRVESGAWLPRIEAVILSEVVTDAMNAVRLATSQKGVALTADLDPRIVIIAADRTSLRQVLSNLLDNALRHTQRGSITVFSRRAPDGAWLGVRDTGEGIAAEHLPRIFDRMYRADEGRARTAGGSGLGLAIVKLMVEAHGGRVEAESQVGTGTTIKAFFPASHSRRRTPSVLPRVTLASDQEPAIA